VTSISSAIVWNSLLAALQVTSLTFVAFAKYLNSNLFSRLD